MYGESCDAQNLEPVPGTYLSQEIRIWIESCRRRIKTPGKHVRVIYTPLDPTFFIEKLGFTGVYIFFFFFFLLKTYRLWGGGSNVYPQSMF